MIRNTLKLLYTYTERALTPVDYSNLLRQRINTASLEQILHQLYLYHNQISVFDYDYYQQCSFRLIDHQKKMNIDDILVVLNIGNKHKIKNQLLWRHFEAEIHTRLHRQIIPLLQEQNKEMKMNFTQAVSEFQTNSQDFFEILNEPLQEQEQQQQQQLLSKDVSPSKEQGLAIQKQNKKSILPKRTTTKYLNQISEQLILNNCKKTDLLKIVLQAQCHPSLRINHPTSVIRLAQMLIYTCQIYSQEYQENKNKYTARSIKAIFKFQGLYLIDFFKLLSSDISKLSIEQIAYITEVLGSFPIKKRQNKRQIIKILSQQLLKRQQSIAHYKNQLQLLLSKDKKLIEKFRNQYGLQQQQIQSN